MWKKIENPEEIKKVPMGSKVRINGETYILQAHWPDDNDYGFNTNPPWRDSCVGHIFAACEYKYNTVEYWVEESNSCPEPLIKNPYPNTEVVRGRKDVDEYAFELEQAMKDMLDKFSEGYRVTPRDMKAVFDDWYLFGSSVPIKKQSFSCYRYTRVPGPEANNYPSLAWKLVCEGDHLYFAVARCSENDQFSYQQARNLLDKRIIFDYYHIERSDASLVEDALRALEGTPGQFENQVVRDYYRLREIIEFDPEIPF